VVVVVAVVAAVDVDVVAAADEMVGSDAVAFQWNCDEEFPPSCPTSCVGGFRSIETEAHVSYHQTPDVSEWQQLASVEVWEEKHGGWEAALLVVDVAAAAAAADVVIAAEEAEASWEWRPSN
jgi:hypothetical protein